MTLIVSTEGLVNVLQRRAFSLRQRARVLPPMHRDLSKIWEAVADEFDGLAEDLKLISS